ncbi:hypothetical protein KKF84_05055 [Myxococcota bacterium]|nr:hypothetical protein [Myxococcota bacterium]MBU1534665.1 hypothetical protein [Myxococcota bacterium]
MTEESSPTTSSPLDSSFPVEPEVPFYRLIDDIFVGLFLPLETMEQVADLQASLYFHLPDEVRNRLTWVPPGWFMVPLLHLGRLPYVLLDVIKDITRNSFWEVTAPLPLTVKGVTTAHDSEGVPRVVSLGFSSPQIVQIQKKLGTLFDQAGFSLKTTEPPLRCTLARAFPDDIPPFMGSIESFQYDLPAEISISRIFAGYRGSNGLKSPPTIVGSFLFGEAGAHRCRGCTHLPELLGADESEEQLMESILSQTGISFESTMELIENEVKNPSLLQQSATLHPSEEALNVTTAVVQDSLRGESQEWEAVQALSGTTSKSQVVSRLAQQKQQWEQRSQADSPAADLPREEEEKSSPVENENTPQGESEKD